MSEMTDAPQGATTAAPSRGGLMKRVTTPARPVWETAFRDPVTVRWFNLVMAVLLLATLVPVVFA